MCLHPESTPPPKIDLCSSDGQRPPSSHHTRSGRSNSAPFSSSSSRVQAVGREGRGPMATDLKRALVVKLASPESTRCEASTRCRWRVVQTARGEDGYKPLAARTVGTTNETISPLAVKTAPLRARRGKHGLFGSAKRSQGSARPVSAWAP